MSSAKEPTEILSKLYQGTVDDRAWDEGLMGLAALVGGEGPLLMSSRHDTGDLVRYNIYSYDPAVFAAYGSAWLAHDPRVPIAGRMPELSLFTEESLLGSRNWLRTPIYNEFLRPNDAPWVLASPLHSNPDRFTLLCIQGTRGRGPFDADDMKAVLPFLPHMRRAMEIKDRFERQPFDMTARCAMWDHLPFGIAILDEGQRVLEASSFAVAAIDSLGVTSLRQG